MIVIFEEDSALYRSELAGSLGKGHKMVHSIPAMLEAFSRAKYSHILIDQDIIDADREAWNIALWDPHCRDLPRILLGDDPDLARSRHCQGFVYKPFSREALEDCLETVEKKNDSSQQHFINLPTLLSRVGGNEVFAAELLEHFIQDNTGWEKRIENGFSGSEAERDFFFRSLRTSASAIGGDELYSIASTIQETLSYDRIELESLKTVMAATIQEAREHRNDLVGDRALADTREDETTDSVVFAAEFAGNGAEKSIKGAEDEQGKVLEEGGNGESPQQPPLGEAARTTPAEKRVRILVVDDSSTNRIFIKSCLEDDYEIDIADNGRAAIDMARIPPRYHLILLDVSMPGLDGYETCRLLKEDPRTSAIPIIFLTGQTRTQDEEKGLEVGAVDYIRKPFSVPILKARIKTQLELRGYRDYLEQMVEDRTQALRETQREVVFRLALAAEYRDNDTGTHIKRIGYYAMCLAERIHMGRRESDTLYFASSMHDVGKIGIPDRILLKPGKLEEKEWEIMKTHTSIGWELLGGQGSELLRMASLIALTHHEKWDGTGYPQGLSGENIPLVGRIVSIVDVFDALLSERPYKRAWSSDEALDEINRLSGSHFDPAVVKAFNDSFTEIMQISQRFRD